MAMTQEEIPMENIGGADGISDVRSVVSLPALEHVMHTLNQFLVQSSQIIVISDNDSQLSDVICSVLREMFES